MVALVGSYGTGFEMVVGFGMFFAACVSAFAMWLTVKQSGDEDDRDEHEKEMDRLRERNRFLQDALDQSERRNQQLMQRLLNLRNGDPT